MNDNCFINVYPAGDKYVAATESDFMHTFSPDTLESQQQVWAHSLYIVWYPVSCNVRKKALAK